MCQLPPHRQRGRFAGELRSVRIQRSRHQRVRADPKQIPGMFLPRGSVCGCTQTLACSRPLGEPDFFSLAIQRTQINARETPLVARNRIQGSTGVRKEPWPPNADQVLIAPIYAEQGSRCSTRGRHTLQPAGPIFRIRNTPGMVPATSRVSNRLVRAKIGIAKFTLPP
jgi:hypothetical protein